MKTVGQSWSARNIPDGYLGCSCRSGLPLGHFEKRREDARLRRGRPCDQETGDGATSDSAFPGSLIQGGRCDAGPFSPRINIPSSFQRNASTEPNRHPYSEYFGTRNIGWMWLARAKRCFWSICYRNPALGKTGKLSRRPLVRTDAADMLKRRLKQAGLPAHYSPHSFRATGITNFLENDGTPRSRPADRRPRRQPHYETLRSPRSEGSPGGHGED
jgi:integrase